MPDCILGLLMDDDRLPLVIDSVASEITGDLSWVEAVHPAVWQAISAGMGLGKDFDLRDRCVSSCLVSAGCIFEGLRYVRRHPWSLCAGDLGHVLWGLGTGECPEEETARKALLLIKLGYDPACIKAGLVRMQQVSHNAITTEQAHAVGSTMLKLHSMYADGTMRDKAFVSQLKPLSVKEPLEERLQVLLGRLDKVKNRYPSKLGARQVYVGEVMALATKKKKGGWNADKMCTMRIMKTRAAMWSRMAIDQQASCKEVTELRQEDARIANQEEMSDLVRQIDVLRRRLQEHGARHGVAMRLSQCKLDGGALKEFDDFIDKCPRANNDIAKLRQVNCADKGGPASYVMDALACFEVQQLGSREHHFSWLRGVCRNRGIFNRCLFCFGEPQGVAYLFVYALQNPFVGLPL